ncbi:hypothetical protein [Fluviicola chungangensis]|uniref:Uncharacterized protein n=1 Tax=Fluviicola chungangensis TaxID=2597671 RepID=A0A556N3D4_9FLAO|nr:hypothetical protein [Fluviicola chungangensis]TSJ46558.1 hypothetical protein FO442_05205 [Fluviicola chungangensis]
MDSVRSPVFSIGRTDIDIGANAGVQSNFSDKRGRMNHFMEVSSSFIFKGIPLTFQGRLSDEKYISGKPTYFRLSYDALAKYRMRKAELEGEIGELNTGIGDINQDIYAMEGKISYLAFLIEQYQLLKQQNKLKIPNGLKNPELPDGKIPDITGKIPDTKLPDLNVPERNKIDFEHLNLDSINLKISAYKGTIDKWTAKKDSLQELKDLKLNDLNALNLKRPNGFLDGIKRFDVGLTSLSGGKMSNSSVPIQGVRVKGTYRNYFYDVAAGLTVPNKLFSNSVVDQYLNNSQNVFNMNQFFTVNTARFVSSAIIGYGNEERNSVSIENYYNGRDLQSILKKVKQVTNNTTNVSFTLSPLASGRLLISGSVGQTIPLGDSVSRNYSSRLAATTKVKYRFRRGNTQIYGQVKRIGVNYDGFSQGMYNSGFLHHEYGFQTKLFKHLTISGKYTGDCFDANSKGRGLITNGIHIDVQESIIKNLLLFAGYSLINARGNDSITYGNNTLYRGGFVYQRKFKKSKFTLSGNSTYSHVNGVDSAISMTNVILKSEIAHRYLFYGVTANYQNFQGMKLIYGSNIIISPELGASYKGIKFSSAFNYLTSEQFSRQYGFSFTLSASPGKHLTWYLTGRRWLPTDALNFITPDVDYPIRPWFWELRLKIHLNVLK